MTATEDLRQPRSPEPGDPKTGPKTTVTHRLVAALRDRILANDLEPGSRIVVDDIRQRYSVSHIPVREALRTLEGEGLIQSVPNHGARVTDLSASEIDGLYELRLIVETALIARACTAKTPEDVERAKRALDAMGRLDPVNDPVRFQEAHRDFHAALILPATTDVTRRILEPVWQSVQRYLVRMYRLPVVAPRGSVQHPRIFEAWAAGDERCVDFLRSHLEGGRTQMAKALGADSCCGHAPDLPE
ncbi:GntR family transcriptional regulator [Mycobacterium sp. 236(2023)]|uniref:GntR family transcriptional regulator n=1 Tax=Mycobacterium sp. 236(2023) TaxID=3038163 RepID=UPI002415419A|nr:GntR family transcriptional regulator [Mycobacterium sp. 236(2023)]MDG4663803.1 GntR family transcriptional regulator [Mycobacterium sp. 236(2023)]